MLGPLDCITYQWYRVQKPLDMVDSAFLSFHGRPNWCKQLRRTWWLKLSCPLAMLLHPLIRRTLSIKKAHCFQFFLSYELMVCEVFTWLSVWHIICKLNIFFFKSYWICEMSLQHFTACLAVWTKIS